MGDRRQAAEDAQVKEGAQVVNPVVIGNATLYLGDCLEILPTLPKVDAVITDPPYGIGFVYENARDRDRDYQGGYVRWMRGVVDACIERMSDGAPCFVWQSQKRLTDFKEMFPSGFRVLVSAKTMGQIFPGCPMQYRWDPVVVFWSGKGRSFDNGAFDFVLSENSAEYGDGSSIEREHPCPRPLKAVLHVMKKWTLPGWSVLDPFMGSGTSGVASQQMGRRFIGIEKEPKYFDIACRRIEQAQAQGKLFEPEQPKPEQLSL